MQSSLTRTPVAYRNSSIALSRNPAGLAQSGALSGGAAQSWVLTNRSGRMIDNDYPLGFKVALHRKDLAIALDLAAQLGATLPVSALAAQLENGLITVGHGEDDMSALARSIRGLSGLDD